MKVLTAFCFMLVLFIGITATAQEGHRHNHDHAPGHCPACDFDISQAKNPTPFKGEVTNWYAEEEEDESTGAFSLILALVGGSTLLIALGLRKLNKAKSIAT